MRIVFGAGGTGGHIIPALAIAHEMLKVGWEPHFIGNRAGMEERLVAVHKFPFHPIKVQKIYRKFTLAHLRFPWLLLKSIIDSHRIIKRVNPAAVLCTGSFITGPVAIATLLAGKPLYLHESNSYPGLAIRLLAPYARICFLTWHNSICHLGKSRTQLVGTPIMCDGFDDHNLDWNDYGLSSDRPKILVSGGSQGSAVINNTIDACSQQLIGMGYDLVWQTGKSAYHKYAHKYETNPSVFVFDFTNEMPTFLIHSCIAITRAGAVTIAELEAAKRPAILIPLPTAADNHQYWNASEQMRKGVAIMIEQRLLSPDILISTIQQIRENHHNMQNILDGLPPNRAARDIASIINQQVNCREKQC